MIAIFDLDGCVSDDRWRRHLLPKNSGNVGWDEYHSYCWEDAPVNVELVVDHLDRSDSIVFVTARPEQWRWITERWITERLMNEARRRFAYILFMRPNGDARRSPRLKVELVDEYGIEWENVVAYDDREDVLAEYRARGAARVNLVKIDSVVRSSTPEVLRAMATTFEERNAVYGDNYKKVAPIIEVLFPGGVPSSLVTSPHWHLFELIVVKLTRFATSELTHVDSIHDAAVYAAMIQNYLEEQKYA